MTTKNITAQRIAMHLRRNADDYHTGTIEIDVWKTRNVALWQEAERLGVDTAVKDELRHAQGVRP